ncbi:hypothetical protein LB504_002259 [Fusarium proliferatum]|nr:hypothetical protein LB504_002259 [Fusarium proliferatum]
MGASPVLDGGHWSISGLTASFSVRLGLRPDDHYALHNSRHVPDREETRQRPRRNSLLASVTSPTVIHSPQFPSP